MPLPRLEIRSDADAMTLRHMQVLLDGVPIPGLQSVDLRLRPDDVNTLSVDISVSGVTIDPKTYALLEAYVTEE